MHNKSWLFIILSINNVENLCCCSSFNGEIDCNTDIVDCGSDASC